MSTMKKPASPGVEFFDDDFGNFIANRRLVSRLVNQYPRKIGPLAERAYDLRLALAGVSWRIASAAARQPGTRNILLVGIEVEARPDWMGRVLLDLQRTRHAVTTATKTTGGKLRVENLNMLISRCDLSQFDWVFIIDDDIAIPHGFIDSFVFLAEHFGFSIAQPAHNLVSHSSFDVNRRKWGAIARQTGFVETGPLVGFHKSTFSRLLPFPDVGMGHGLDIHWAYVAGKMGWKLGVLDALPIRHLRPVGGSYNRAEMRQSAIGFIAENGGVYRRDALRTVRSFKSL